MSGEERANSVSLFEPPEAPENPPRVKGAFRIQRKSYPPRLVTLANNNNNASSPTYMWGAVNGDEVRWTESNAPPSLHDDTVVILPSPIVRSETFPPYDETLWDDEPTNNNPATTTTETEERDKKIA